MNKFRAPFLLACLLSFLLPAESSFALLDGPAVEHARKAEGLLQQGMQFQAIAEYRQAILYGVHHPDVYRNLAIALFEVGHLDDALAELEKAVAIFPGGDLMHLELGILYLARNNLEKSRTHLLNALELNPGSAAAYYYLAECFFKAGQFAHAWRATRMAMLFGHPGAGVIHDKLRGVSPEPTAALWRLRENEYHIRQILVDSTELADTILARLRQGELFEDVAGVESLGANAEQGGYAGKFHPAELRPEIVEALSMAGVLGEPFSVKVGEQVQIVQQIPPFDFAFWQAPAPEPMTATAVPVPAASEKNDDPSALLAGMAPATSTPQRQAPLSSADLEKDVAGDEDGSRPGAGVRLIAPLKQKRHVSFIVHAGAFKAVEEAEERLARLLALDLPGYIFREAAANGTDTTYGVVAAKTESYLAALAVVEKLKSLGFDYFINRD